MSASTKQNEFESLFKDQTYGLRGDYTPRAWHRYALRRYQEAIKAKPEGPGPFCFTVLAGTASGKTQCSANFAAFLLNVRQASQVVVVCPNRSIKRRTRVVFRELFGIDLVHFNAGKHAEGIGRAKQGYILTYAHVASNPALHAGICDDGTLVIFDEVHRLGENGWGAAAEAAFGKVGFVVGLTGTPHRTDRAPIPFVRYEDTDKPGVKKLKADVEYNLGMAIADGVCRKPLFRFNPGRVTIRMSPDAAPFDVSFGEEVTDEVAAMRLRFAVKYDSEARLDMLRSALDECRSQGRKVIIFLGGDSDAEKTATEDATMLMPAQLESLGVGRDEFEVVVSDDPEAQDKIERFGQSDKWVLVSVNMVSEGTDIPELSAAVFLTSVTALTTTAQRLGRILRYRGPDDPFSEALAFMLADPRNLKFGDDVEDEWRAEASKKQARPPGGEDGESPHERRARAEGHCFEGGDPTIVKFGGQTFSYDQVATARRWLNDRGLPPTLLNSVLHLMRDGKHASN